MVSAKRAKRARELFADTLFRKGIVGLAVDKVILNGRSTYALIAMVTPDHKESLPNSVDVNEGGSPIAVPVVVRKTTPFKPE